MKRPEWLKVKPAETHETKKILRNHRVSTVCEEARCPNQGKCFSKKIATFMILGDRCTRNCSFCAVEKNIPLPPAHDEPERVAEAVLALGLDFVVITSVTRDDLPDGGAGHFARTIRAVRNRKPGIRVEVLTPDFNGSLDALKTVLDESPEVFNHNIETVPGLYAVVRPGADYIISMHMISSAKALSPNIKTKSGIMLGLGENDKEVFSVFEGLRRAGCDYLTVGQYLRPRKDNIPVVEYVSPEVFEQYRIKALAMGFKSVISSPFARSSMNAEEMYEKM